jgi:quercetin 2,3-dioxygenase
MQIRTSQDRGHANHGWLDSYHSFSFANYYDPAWMGFSVLRVINDDIIAPAKGFGMHSHSDMEIITYILQGELQHKDSLGNGSVIRVGDVQRMTAGTGITHSEFNASGETPVHLLQIWIVPNQQNLPPSYEEKFFNDAQRRNQWCLLASENPENGALKVHQNMALYASNLSAEQALDYPLQSGRSAYLHVATGSVIVNQQPLNAGDAAMFDTTENIQIIAKDDAQILLFDVPL